jgi:ATP phosphoribosyltransferase regulatory subunit
MDINDILTEMSGLEQLIFRLRALYGKAGYRQYQMSKFEEYDLYARNRDFLASEQIISFTDTDGKLMALQPDVTLSIIKNLKDMPDRLQRLYYAERVYRVSSGSGSFQELRQLGLECMGAVDDDALLEVLELACGTLAEIGGQAVLELSQIDILRGIFDAMGLSYAQWDMVLPLVQSKNLQGLKALLSQLAPDYSEASEFLQKLVSAPGDPEGVIRLLRSAGPGLVDPASIDQLEKLIAGLPEDYRKIIRIDFSLTGNSRYYNGIIFQGFILGIPSRVLAGGQYDRMMKRMGKASAACGFALYLNLLERMIDARDAGCEGKEA